jgi:hypothetical protein
MLCEAFGDRVNYYSDIAGIQPLCASNQSLFSSFQDAMPLFGKIVFYESGFVFVDRKYGPYAIDYT